MSQNVWMETRKCVADDDIGYLNIKEGDLLDLDVIPLNIKCVWKVSGLSVDTKKKKYVTKYVMVKIMTMMGW